MSREAEIDALATDRSPRGSVLTLKQSYVLGVVWLVLLLRTVDLQIIAVLLEPIRAEFRVSDTLLGLLSGTAFSILYALLGIPVALLADRYNRRTVIASCLALWSGMTAVCGLATSFWGLLIARVGVGVGEAGGAPPAYSLISDYFPPERRSTIFSLLNTAVPVGVFCGFLIGGIVNANFGWRAALIAIGAFGVAVALVVQFTLKEPVRGRYESSAIVGKARLGETLRYLWQKRSYRHLVAATSVATLGAFGSGVWMLSFFVRVHHLEPGKIATWLAFIYGIGGIVGATSGGALADFMSRRRRNSRWQGWVPAISVGSIFPLSFVLYLSSAFEVALLALIGTVLLMHMWMGPAYGTIQSLVDPKSRATAAAVNLLVVNLLALGCGPLLVGVISDFFAARYGESAIRYAILLLVTVAYSWASVHFFLAAKHFKNDLRAST